ncbi:TetR/AcrR family transcriptional regulator [Amycolatopsis carbonis]|uniref:TetR/AcrR family transcriptional regulator n=1 Tax=Amycolatopsis carbonis TaxID=715471 RepID=A0A9Y2I8D6_9PSEU|nr:TetR/AcrR family transcriptional regulator [Amycolatopsis sp. 2-15]WIX75457.1 TetR/AcrR family transcriptional regulator [Amycolatopsis sp. 2-15]
MTPKPTTAAGAQAPSARDLRTATLDAAARLLATAGPDGLTIRKIAAAAGCSTITVYHYFQNKQGLLDAVYVEGHTRLSEAQRRQQFTDDPEADVRNTCLVYRDIALANRYYFHVMFGQLDSVHRPTGDTRATGRENFARFIEVVRRWGERTPLRTDPESAAHALWACGHGMVALELTDNAPHSAAAHRYRTAIDLMMTGLRT